MAHVIDAVIQLRDEFTGTIEQASKGLTEFSKQRIRTGRQIERTGRDLMKVGSTLTKSVTLPLVGIGAAAVKTYIDMEDAFSGIKKTVTGTPEQLLEVKRELDTLATQSIPVARKELYGIAETAGQLGVAREHIIGFTETVAKIGRVTNLTYEEGSASLARFANIMGMPMTEMERLGSTIVKLDNSLATSAAEIVDMGMRLAGAGKQAGFTEAQVLGLAGALSSVGLESQAGGSAFSKVLLEMNSAVFSGGEELRRFAKVAGMTTSEFATMWREDAAGATTKFIQGLNKLKSEGKNVTGIIEGLGFTELRTRDALLRSTEASELFADALTAGSRAWEENAALQEVFGTRTDNTAAKIDLMKNKLGLVGEQLADSLMPHVIKGIDMIGGLADKFAALPPAQQETIVRTAAMVAAIGPSIGIIGKLTSTIGGAVKTVGQIGKSIKKAGGIMQWIASPGNTVALVIMGIALAAYLVYKNWDKIGPVVMKVWSYVKPVFVGMGRGAMWVANAFRDSVQWIKTAWGSIGAFFGNVRDQVKSIFDAMIDMVKPLINAFIGGGNFLIGGLNMIKFDVPKWVPIIGGKRWGFDIPEIPKLARGTRYYRGGPAIVGERGPELVMLPRATQVVPADKTARTMRTIREIFAQSEYTRKPAAQVATPVMRSQDAPNITWAPVFNLGPVSSEVDARRLLAQIEDIVEDAARNMPRMALEGM